MLPFFLFFRGLFFSVFDLKCGEVAGDFGIREHRLGLGVDVSLAVAAGDMRENQLPDLASFASSADIFAVRCE